MVYHRLPTIAIGTSLCIFITMVFCPIWVGSGLHNLIVSNLEKLADSLDRCVGEYFKDDKTKLGNEEDPSKRMQGYKCVLNSKATEEVMANLAIPQDWHINVPILQDGNLHMAYSTFDIHGNNTSRLAHQCVSVLIALRLSTVA
ncbi:hypothetical protein CMV_008236 [Castanea mollissima]|uniref:Uncharacterized protein n=1 Tax=Castanea mollissima TaxID=60419 RepID=A0A8J4VS04_9ROSI|nr:hypothetical protein CMV_008236 [Castanea mollissima]